MRKDTTSVVQSDAGHVMASEHVRYERTEKKIENESILSMKKGEQVTGDMEWHWVQTSAYSLGNAYNRCV